MDNRTKATGNTVIERENKEKSFETTKVIENTAIKKESKKKPLKTEKVPEDTTIEKKSKKKLFDIFYRMNPKKNKH